MLENDAIKHLDSHFVEKSMREREIIGNFSLINLANMLLNLELIPLRYFLETRFFFSVCCRSVGTPCQYPSQKEHISGDSLLDGPRGEAC